MTMPRGLEFRWLAAVLSGKDMGRPSHLSWSHYSQWSLTAPRLRVYKSARQKRKHIVILFCSGMGEELSSRSPSSVAPISVMCSACRCHSQIPSVLSLTLFLGPCASEPSFSELSFSSWARLRQQQHSPFLWSSDGNCAHFWHRHSCGSSLLPLLSFHSQKRLVGRNHASFWSGSLDARTR